MAWRRSLFNTIDEQFLLGSLRCLLVMDVAVDGRLRMSDAETLRQGSRHSIVLRLVIVRCSSERGDDLLPLAGLLFSSEVFLLRVATRMGCRASNPTSMM